MKYYYDNQLSAEWMAYAFGMNFVERFSFDVRYEGEAEKRGIDKWLKLEIHHDSLHLLEPKEKIDLVQYVEFSQQIQKDGSPHKLVEDYFYGIWQPTTKQRGITYKNHYKKIIQRDGIPFHWPLIEE